MVDNPPTAAFKRIAEDLKTSRRKAELYEINMNRINDFINKPYNTAMYRSFDKLEKDKGINNDESDLSGISVFPGYQEVSSIITLQNKPEFQNCLGSRSRFGDGDGSFFDVWLNTPYTDRKRRGKGGGALDPPKHLPRNGPLHGIKAQYAYHNIDPTGEARRKIVMTYEERVGKQNSADAKAHSPIINEQDKNILTNQFQSEISTDQELKYQSQREIKHAFYDQYRDLQRHHYLASSQSSAKQPTELNSQTPVPSVSPRTRFLNACVSERVEPPLNLIPVGIDVNPIFDISSSPIPNDKIAFALAKSISYLSHLDYINVSRCNLSGEGLASVLLACQSSSMLRGIDISHNRFSGEAIDKLVQLIEQLPRIEELVLRGLGITEEKLVNIIEAIKYRNTVKYLDLGENNLGMIDINYRKKASSLTQGRRKSNSNLSLDSSCLSDYLGLSFCSIEALKLDWNKIRGDRVSSLLNLLHLNTSLTYLDLSSNSLGAFGGEWLGQSILRNNSLKVVKVAKNNINSTGCYTIVCGLRFCPTMKEIDISDNPIGDIGINSIVRLLIDFRRKDKNIEMKDLSFRIQNYSTCWVGNQASGTLSCDSVVELREEIKYDETTKYDLSKPYERAKCLERLNALATFIPSDNYSICISPIVLRVKGRNDSASSGDEDSVLHVITVQDASYSDPELGSPMNTPKASQIKKSPMYKSLPSPFRKTTTPSRYLAKQRSTKRSTNPDSKVTFSGLPLQTWAERNTLPSISAKDNPSTPRKNINSLYFVETFLSRAKALYEQYDTTGTKMLSHEKIRIIVKALMKDIKDTTMTTILGIHESIECGAVREEEFLAVTRATLLRLQRSMRLRRTNRYYSQSSNAQSKVYNSASLAPPRYSLPLSGIATIIIPETSLPRSFQ